MVLKPPFIIPICYRLQIATRSRTKLLVLKGMEKHATAWLLSQWLSEDLNRLQWRVLQDPNSTNDEMKIS